MRAVWAAVIEAQRGHLFAWSPVVLAAGIGAYFAAPIEPGAPAYALALLLALCGAGGAILLPRLRPLFMVALLIGAGFCLAGARSHAVAGPVMGWRYHGPVEGRVVAIDRSFSDKPRLTLDSVILANVSPEKTPARVRIALHGAQDFLDPAPGMRVMMTAHVSPPEGPVEPGGFDFQRMAWFDGLGGVGYTRDPVLRASDALPGRAALWATKLRARISAAVQGAMPGEEGAFAAAILTGDRSGMSQETKEALRASNLAHLLAISGLHMGLLTGVVFGALRIALALVPWLALRAPTKKIAALGAIAAGVFYLILSGGNVATERAFIMVAVMFGAVVFDRRALSLRAVALAALIVLVRRPEVLGEPGFQMSFAATSALVAVFGWLRTTSMNQRLPKWARPVAALVISSAVAGLATAPVAAAHFNRIADYGLLANLLSVPLMGMIVMPAAVLSAALAPLGLSEIGLFIMRPAISWILGVAEWVAGLSGSTTAVPSPGPLVLPLFALGGLAVMLLQGRVRAIGLAPLAASFALWTMAERPVALIAPSGALVGVMGPEGRALSREKGAGFAAQSWLENDGDRANQAAAWARGGFERDGGVARAQIGTMTLVHLSGKKALSAAASHCAPGVVIVANGALEAENLAVAGGCRVYDAGALRESGALALVGAPGQELALRSARQVSGARLWNTRALREAREGGAVRRLLAMAK